MGKLIVRKEYLDSEIHYGRNNSSVKVVLKDASQRDLEILKETGNGDFDHLFEDPKKEAKEK